MKWWWSSPAWQRFIKAEVLYWLLLAALYAAIIRFVLVVTGRA